MSFVTPQMAKTVAVRRDGINLCSFFVAVICCFMEESAGSLELPTLLRCSQDLILCTQGILWSPSMHLQMMSGTPGGLQGPSRGIPQTWLSYCCAWVEHGLQLWNEETPREFLLLNLRNHPAGGSWGMLSSCCTPSQSTAPGVIVPQEQEGPDPSGQQWCLFLPINWIHCARMHLGTTDAAPKMMSVSPLAKSSRSLFLSLSTNVAWSRSPKSHVATLYILNFSFWIK